MPDPVFVAAEGTTLKIGSALIGQVLSVKPPGAEIEPVKTTHLTSDAATTRPSQIPDNGEVTFKVEVNPADAGYGDLVDAFTVKPIVNKQFTITYGGDGFGTPGTDVFTATPNKLEFDELEENTNLIANVTVKVSGAVARTGGSA